MYLNTFFYSVNCAGLDKIVSRSVVGHAEGNAVALTGAASSLVSLPGGRGRQVWHCVKYAGHGKSIYNT